MSSVKSKNMIKTELRKEAERHQNNSLLDLFLQDVDRAEKYSFELGELFIDFSKNHIDDKSFKTLMRWAEKMDLKLWREKLFSGEAINHTENRSVLHMALRGSERSDFNISGSSVMPDVLNVRERCFAFAKKIRRGELLGFTGKPINTIVNIGIGGSDLGPKLMVDALKKFHLKGIKAHFISRLGEDHLNAVLEKCDVEQTLFIVASKTFATLETMENANVAKKHCVKILGNQAIPYHFAAVSCNIAATNKFGISEENVFHFWDWVGGRYSVWSAVGLTALIVLGESNFKAILEGAESVDKHFYSAPLEKNIPVIMALLGAWYSSYWKFPAHAILSYDENLALLTPYLQQLDMESNGKITKRNGSKSEIATGPIIFGGLGNDGQHAYYQWFHQGSKKNSADFFAAVKSHGESKRYHSILLANCFAQSQALMVGRGEEKTYAVLSDKGLSPTEIEKLLPYCTFEGNRPSTTFLYPQLTPKVLGMLLALYEHKIFVQGVLWEINSFDQWGVELGKELAQEITELFKKGVEVKAIDSSTEQLIQKTKNILLDK